MKPSGLRALCLTPLIYSITKQGGLTHACTVLFPFITKHLSALEQKQLFNADHFPLLKHVVPDLNTEPNVYRESNQVSSSWFMSCCYPHLQLSGLIPCHCIALSFSLPTETIRDYNEALIVVELRQRYERDQWQC